MKLIGVNKLRNSFSGVTAKEEKFLRDCGIDNDLRDWPGSCYKVTLKCLFSAGTASIMIGISIWAGVEALRIGVYSLLGITAMALIAGSLNLMIAIRLIKGSLLKLGDMPSSR